MKKFPTLLRESGTVLPIDERLFAYLAKNRNKSFWLPVTLSSLSAKYTES